MPRNHPKPRRDKRFQKKHPKILVACPVYDGKAYCFGEWVRRVGEFTYRNFQVFTVDNSETLDFYNHWKQLVPMVHIERDTSSDRVNINRSMELIRQKYLAGDYDYWFNLEADNIPPVDVIERLLEYPSDWTSHAYPIREYQVEDQQGIGCSLLSRRLIQDFDFTDAGNTPPDRWLWQKVRPLRKYQVIELWGYFKIEHLMEPI